MLMRILPLALATLSMASASADEAEIKKAMEAKLGAKVESVTKSGFLGLYEVYSEGNILYTDEKMTASAGRWSVDRWQEHEERHQVADAQAHCNQVRRTADGARHQAGTRQRHPRPGNV